MLLNNAQLQTLLQSAGFPAAVVPTMAAIGMAESSGRTDAVNPGRGAGGRRTNEFSVGLFQINTLVHKNYTVEQLKNPHTNAKEALRIYNLQGLRAWGAYTDKRYLKFLTGPAAGNIAGTDDVRSTLTDFGSIGAGAVMLGAVALLFLLNRD